VLLLITWLGGVTAIMLICRKPYSSRPSTAWQSQSAMGRDVMRCNPGSFFGCIDTGRCDGSQGFALAFQSSPVCILGSAGMPVCDPGHRIACVVLKTLEKGRINVELESEFKVWGEFLDLRQRGGDKQDLF
jgi:hypothetical protein